MESRARGPRAIAIPGRASAYPRYHSVIAMPIDRALQVLATLVLIAAGMGIVGASRLVLAWSRPAPRRRELMVAAAFAAPASLGIAIFSYGAWIEADRLEETRIEVRTPKLPAGSRLRIVQVSDTHADERTPLIGALAERINALDPDLFLFTGDAANSAAGVAAFRAMVESIRARYGSFAVRGNHDVWYWRDSDLFGSGAKELEGRPVKIGELPVWLCGAPWSPRVRRGFPASEDLLALAEPLEECLAQSGEGFRIVAHHTPDLIEEVAPRGSDLFLAGHTHGGQVRLPFYGALESFVTSRFGKKYEMGRYQVGATTLFVSRGVGFENPPSPALRVLCPPEVAVIDVVGVGPQP